MPALVLFGRRWNIGSDDLVIPSFVDLNIRLAWLIATAVVFWCERKLECSNGYYIKFYFLGMVVITHILIVLDALLLQASKRGSVMDTEPRKNVPIYLYIRIVAELISIGWTVLGAVWLLTHRFACDENTSPVKIIQSLVVFNLVILIKQLLFLMYCYDPIGGSKTLFNPTDVVDEFTVFNIDVSITPTKYTKYWERRFRRYCCKCWGNIGDETQDTFKEIGRIFGSELAEDLVNSDIVAGLMLLNMQRKRELKRLMDSAANVPIQPKCFKVISNQPSNLTFGSSQYNFAAGDEWQSPRFLFHFVKFACAAYGWIFVPPRRLWKSCVCCSCLPKRNYPYPKKVEGDNCCLCCTSGVRDLNKIEFEDIAHVTFRNKLFENPFFVCVDHKTKAIVLSIRGTLSLHDVIMDMTGWPVQIPGYPPSFKAHHGMMKGALNLKQKLDRMGVIDKLLTANPDYTIVVTGQSLGSGLATLVSLLLRLEHPDNLKCYAYSPPGGLLSREAAEYCNDFVVSVIYGDDFISRLGLLQFERLKFRLKNILTECKVPKYRILLGGFFCCLKYTAKEMKFNDSDAVETRQLEGEREDLNSGSYTNFESAFDIEPDLGSGSEISATESANASTMTMNSGAVNGYQTNSKYSQANPQTCYTTVEGMYPPGKIFYVTEVPKKMRISSDCKWNWRWADRTEFDDIVVSNKMIWDHIPIKMPKSLRFLAQCESGY